MQYLIANQDCLCQAIIRQHEHFVYLHLLGNLVTNCYYSDVNLFYPKWLQLQCFNVLHIPSSVCCTNVVKCFCNQLIFNRHAHDRTISFSTIATAAQVPLTEVSDLFLSNNDVCSGTLCYILRSCKDDSFTALQQSSLYFV